MRILLDTNIILNGAFKKSTVAYDLINATQKLTFYLSYSSLKEVESLIKENCYSSEKRNVAFQNVRSFLVKLGCIILSPGNPASSLEIVDSDDRAIVSTAKETEIDTICTYNIDDFLDFSGEAKTPLELTREFSRGGQESFFRLSSNKIGTLFSIIKPVHESEIGDLFITDEGHEFFINKEGYLATTGDFPELKIKNKINGGQRIGLIIRNKPNFFEVSCWKPKKDNDWYHGNAFTKKVIAHGNVDINNPIDLKLCTNTGIRHFTGHLMNISTASNFIREAQLKKALGAMCLDVIYGSESIANMLENI